MLLLGVVGLDVSQCAEPFDRVMGGISAWTPKKLEQHCGEQEEMSKHYSYGPRVADMGSLKSFDLYQSEDCVLYSLLAIAASWPNPALTREAMPMLVGLKGVETWDNP